MSRTTSDEPRPPWLAYTRSGPSHKALAVSVDHGSMDGVKTLCGCEAAGCAKDVAFDPTHYGACKRCARALEGAGRGGEGPDMAASDGVTRDVAAATSRSGDASTSVLGALAEHQPSPSPSAPPEDVLARWNAAAAAEYPNASETFAAGNALAAELSAERDHADRLAARLTHDHCRDFGAPTADCETCEAIAAHVARRATPKGNPSDAAESLQTEPSA